MLKTKKTYLPVIILSLIFIFNSCSKEVGKDNSKLLPVALNHINTEGELKIRINKNMDRLEESKYQPENVFLSETESGNWPGDTEGRTILGLVLDAQSAHRTPIYLDQIIALIPEHLNEEGYMGIIYKNKMNEQQLAGNGWMLRGLCEYYEWKNDEKVLPIIQSISNNLFVKGKGYYTNYPIDPKSHIANVGAESGSIQNEKNDWMLSSDIGCVFIGMEGLIHAYKYLRTPEIKEVIEEMINVFLKIDLVTIKAQTHASLTACRGLIRFAEITGEKKYIDEAEKRWRTYKENGMTENYENYNWFNRFDTWTEPCAIVDSYLLAVQLWQHTGNPTYREDAELIYYNGIGHTQRHNGGFGCDNCPGNKIQNVCLKVHIDEAHWCCTMRGGEGLSKAAEYSYFVNKDTVFIPFYHSGKLSMPMDGENILSLEQITDYPFGGKVNLVIDENTTRKVSLKLAVSSYTSNHSLKINDKPQKSEINNGFVTLTQKFKKGDVIELTFDQNIRISSPINKLNTSQDQLKVYYGPLLLGSEDKNTFALDKKDEIIPLDDMSFMVKDKNIILTPVYHLMDSKVWKGTDYQKQIIF